MFWIDAFNCMSLRRFYKIVSFRCIVRDIKIRKGKLETLIELYRNAHTWSFQRQILCKIVKDEDFQEVKNVRNNWHENYIFKCFNLALFLKFFVVDIQMILDKKNLRSFEKDSLKKGWNRSKLKCSILKESGQFKLGYSWNALTSKLFKIVEKNFEMYFKPGIT